MKISSILSLTLLALPSLGKAVYMSGGGYEVRITMVGAAGNGKVVVPAGTVYTVMRAVGFVTQGQNLGAADGSLVLPGLFGGAPGMIPHAYDWTQGFGSSTAPASLFVAANSLSQDYMIFTASSPTTAPLRVSPVTIEQANAKLAESGATYTHPLADCVWEVSFMREDGSLQAPRQAINGTLSLPYDDADNDGVVDNTHPPVRASTLSLWWLDEDRSLWVRLPDSQVNLSSHTVSAHVTYASVFALMGSPDTAVGAVRAVPSPWRPNGPHAGDGPGQTGTAAGGITFNSAPQEGFIRIYTLSGALVRELELNGNYQPVWDGRNESGQDAATGVYIFTVESQNNRKSGKLAIIR